MAAGPPRQNQPNQPNRVLNRLDVLRALKVSNIEAIFATAHATLTGGAFQTGFALMLGASDFWMGVLGAFPTLAGLVQVPASYVVERRGERKWLTAWLTGFGRLLWLPILLLPWALADGPRFTAFVALLLVSSLVISASGPAFTSWMADLVPADYRGRYFGRRNMLAGITTMLVSLPAAWFLDLATRRHIFPDRAGFATLFALAVVCALGSFACLSRQAEPPMRRADAPDASNLRGLFAFYRAPLREPDFRRLLVYGGLFAFSQFFAGPFYTVYALTVLRLDYVWLQIFAAISSLAGLLSMPLWGYLGDKFGNKPLLAIANFGVALTPILWVMTSRQHMTATLAILCVNNLIGGLFWAGVGLAQFNLLIGATPDERKSVYVGAFSAATGLLGGIAPIICGVLVTRLRGIELVPLGWPMDNFQIVFAINSAQRFAVMLLLRPIRDRGAASARAVLTQIGSAKPAAWMHIHRLQRAQTEEGRLAAMQAVRSNRATLAVEEVIAALDDPSLHVREEAAEALGALGDARAVEALAERLTDPASGIVEQAAEALGRIGDERAVGALGRLLAAGEALERVAAARALGCIGGAHAVAPLLGALDADGGMETLEVREAAASALGVIGAPEAVPKLAALLESAPRPLRLAAIRALGDICDARAASPLLRALKREQDPAIIAQLAVALGALGTLGEPDAIEAVGTLLDALDRLESPIARKQVLHAVGALLGAGDAFYALLAVEPLARDEAVARIVEQMRRRERRVGQSEFGARRRSLEYDRVLDRYVEGDYNGALRGLAWLQPHAKDGPQGQALAWALRTAARRSLLAEEFLLALFAARS